VIWKMVLTCLLWCVWKERNNKCFKDLEDSLASFFLTCIFGQWLLCPLCLLVLVILLFVFHFLVRCFLLFTSGVLRGALRF